MANTYTQAYFHLVFAVRKREALIEKQWRESLEKFITGVVRNHNHKPLAIKAVSDHIHIFIGYNINGLIPDLVEEIKTSSNNWVKIQQLSKFKFEWQNGYGAFTHSHAQVSAVINYINNQEKHHAKSSFRDEYFEMLKKNEVAFKPEYLFDFFDDVD